jgi:hypothetical protein
MARQKEHLHCTLCVAQALRTCPLCRAPTHFITPSTTWPETPADKEAVVDAYKASMADKVSSSSSNTRVQQQQN